MATTTLSERLQHVFGAKMSDDEIVVQVAELMGKVEVYERFAGRAPGSGETKRA